MTAASVQVCHGRVERLMRHTGPARGAGWVRLRSGDHQLCPLGLVVVCHVRREDERVRSQAPDVLMRSVPQAPVLWA